MRLAVSNVGFGIRASGLGFRAWGPAYLVAGGADECYGDARPRTLRHRNLQVVQPGTLIIPSPKLAKPPGPEVKWLEIITSILLLTMNAVILHGSYPLGGLGVRKVARIPLR